MCTSESGCWDPTQVPKVNAVLPLLTEPPPQSLLWSDHQSFGRQGKKSNHCKQQCDAPEGLGEIETSVDRNLSKGTEREQIVGPVKSPFFFFKQILDWLKTYGSSVTNCRLLLGP